MARTEVVREFRNRLVSGGWDLIHADIAANAFEVFISRDDRYLTPEDEHFKHKYYSQRMDMLVQSILDEDTERR